MKSLALPLTAASLLLGASALAQTAPGAAPPPAESQPGPTMPRDSTRPGTGTPDSLPGMPTTPGEGDAADAPDPAMPPTTRAPGTATPGGTMPAMPGRGTTMTTPARPAPGTPATGMTTPGSMAPGTTGMRPPARSGPMTAPPPATTMDANPPLCSRTVRDNCMQREEAPRGYRPG